MNQRFIFPRYLIITFILVISSGIVEGDDQKVTIIEISHIKTGGRTDFVEVVNDVAYIFDFENGFFVYGIHNPWKPIFLDSLSFDNYIDPRVHGGHDFVIQGSLAVLDFTHSGIKIVNIENPRNLEVIGSYNSGGEYYYIDVVENLVYCAKSTDGLEILDISSPTDPIKVGEFSNGHGLYFIAVLDQIAYLSDLNHKQTLCLNISDPTNITEVNQLDWLARKMEVDDEIGYIGYFTQNTGLGIYNFSDPLNPVLLSEFYDGGNVHDIKIREHYLFIADHSDGIEVIDVQKPANPVEITQWANGGECTNLDIVNNLIITANQMNGSKCLLIEGLDLGEISYFTKPIPGWTFLLLILGIISLSVFYRKKSKF